MEGIGELGLGAGQMVAAVANGAGDLLSKFWETARLT